MWGDMIGDIYRDMNSPRNLVDIDILDILGKYYWEN